MTIQMPVFDKAGARMSKTALPIEAPVDDVFDVRKFLENFDVLVSAAGGPLALRQLVLELAVRGRLVPTSTESVAPLLSQIEEKRATLVAARKASRADGLAPVRDGDAPFAIPSSWRWVRFGHATICRDGQRIPISKDQRSGRQGEYDYYGASGVIDKIDEFIFDEPLLLIGEDGANLLNRSTPIAFIASGKYWVNNHAHVLDSACVDMLKFLAIFINAIDLAPFVTGTAQPKMNQAKMNAIPVAVPPLAEQKRIVARVDQLMALIDDLEAKQAKKRDLSTRFTKASLEALTTADSPEAFGPAWKRVLDNFPTLLEGSDKVSALRARIQGLAIAGRLCRSSSEDGTASRELARILSERGALVGKDAAPPVEGPRPSLPSSWCWTSLDALLIVLRNGVSTRPEGLDGVPVLRISAVRPNAVQIGEIRYLPGSRRDYAGFFVKPGDLLFTRYSGNAEFVGACGVVPDGAPQVVHPDKLIRGEVVPGLVDPNFVALAMSTGTSRAYIDMCGQTTAGQIGISGKQLKSAPIPLPPLVEQRRIVAMVGRLMKLCDDLEAKLRHAGDLASNLVEAVVQEMVAL